MDNKPIISTRDRGLSISIFKREKDGQSFYGACLQRSWKDKNTDEWKREQINLFPDELLKLAALCNRTYEQVITHGQANRPTTGGANYPAQPIEDSSYPAPTPTSNVFDDDVPF